MRRISVLPGDLNSGGAARSHDDFITAAGKPQAIGRILLIITALIMGSSLLVTVQAGSEPAEIVTSFPKAHDVVDGTMVVVSLRFNARVDHQSARFLLKGDEGVRELRARLRSAPNALFAIVGHLTPGPYELTWEARLADGRTVKDWIPFTVK
jgi:methionine-rich copper-binding protein CopC